MSSPLLLLLRSACLVRFIWMVLGMGGKWPYTCYYVECCFQDLFHIARSILVHLQSSFFFVRFVCVHVVHPYSSIDTAAVWKKCRFISSNRSKIKIMILEPIFLKNILVKFFFSCLCS